MNEELNWTSEKVISKVKQGEYRVERLNQELKLAELDLKMWKEKLKKKELSLSHIGQMSRI